MRTYIYIYIYPKPCQQEKYGQTNKLIREIKTNKEQITHQKTRQKTQTDLKKIQTKETLTLQNTVRLKIVIFMTANHRNQNRQAQRNLTNIKELKK